MITRVLVDVLCGSGHELMREQNDINSTHLRNTQPGIRAQMHEYAKRLAIFPGGLAVGIP